MPRYEPTTFHAVEIFVFGTDKKILFVSYNFKNPFSNWPITLASEICSFSSASREELNIHEI